MATLKELRDERLSKLKKLRQMGVPAYPASARRDHQLSDIVDKFDELQNSTSAVSGRVVSIRKFGKIAFIVIRDASGSLQLFLGPNLSESPSFGNSELGLKQLNLLDSGDFIEATGPVIKTKTGEISVEVHTLRLLAKSLRTLPTSWDGLADKETRLRRRYVDLNVNRDVYDRFVRRSNFWEANRSYLRQNGFIEINTPILEHTTGGADAKPFVTHMDALGQDFYLRISQELPLKRLIGGGYEKVFDIGPRFRNENYTEEHLPEHTALEWYWAYANWEDGRKFMADMFRYVFEKTYGKSEFNVHGHKVNLAADWQEIDYAQILKDSYELDIFSCSLDDVKQKLHDHKLKVEKFDNKARGIDKLWKRLRKDIAGPAWLVNVPLFISPLAKTSDDNPLTVQRFQAVIGGSELGNGYSELNDPQEQLGRFLEQQKLRDAGDQEAQMLDIDYIEMLEYGMPPTCGWGHSERAFWLLEGVSAREGVPFPQLRSEIDEVTKQTYPEVFGTS